MQFWKRKAKPNPPDLKTTTEDKSQAPERTETPRLAVPLESLVIQEQAQKQEAAGNSDVLEIKNAKTPGEIAGPAEMVKLDQPKKGDSPAEVPAKTADEGKLSLDDLFREDRETRKTPLENFIASLPDIPCRELMEDIEEIKALIAQRNKLGEKKLSEGGG